MRRLAEVVGELHRLQAAVLAEAHAHALEARLALARLGLHPFKAVLLAGVGELERLLDAARAREQRRGRRAERALELAHRDLVQLPVVDPDTLAVADDHLVGGLVVHPAEAAGPLEDKAAARLLRQLAAAVVDLLVEMRARRLRTVEESLVPVEARGTRRKCDEQGDDAQD